MSFERIGKGFVGILLYLWQLPQNIIGLLIRLFCKGEKKREIAGITVYYLKSFPGGISLGKTIMVGSTYVLTAKHERGHQIQSLILGPFYLIIIGLPSLLGNIYDRIFHADWEYEESARWYYNQPWEHWADKLGKVKR